MAINQDMADVIEANSGKIGTFGHGFTYGGHPVACAVGVEDAGDLRADGRAGAGCARWRRGSRAHLDRLAAHPLVGEARGVGLIGALELAPDKSPKGFATPGKVAAAGGGRAAGRAA